MESEMKKDDFSVFIQEGKDHFVVNEGDDIQLKCSANSSVNSHRPFLSLIPHKLWTIINRLQMSKKSSLSIITCRYLDMQWLGLEKNTKY